VARNVEILKEIYEAFGRGEVDPVLSHFDPSVEVLAVTEELLGATPERFETFALQLERFIDGDDMVVVSGRLAPGPSFVHVWGLREGRVTRFGAHAGGASGP
jgi:ketosteroid isomerase-like protein